MVYPSGTGYPGSPGKKAVKRLCVCVCVFTVLKYIYFSIEMSLVLLRMYFFVLLVSLCHQSGALVLGRGVTQAPAGACHANSAQ